MACDVKFYYRSGYGYPANNRGGCVGHENYPDIDNSGLTDSPDNSITSIKIAPQTKLEVWRKKNFQGSYKVWQPSNQEQNVYDLSKVSCGACGGNNWNDEISSFKITHLPTVQRQTCSKGDNNVTTQSCLTFCNDSNNKDICNNARTTFCKTGDNIATPACASFYNWTKDSGLSTAEYDTAWYNYCSKNNNFLGDTCMNYIQNNKGSSKRAEFDDLWTNYCSNTSQQGATIKAEYDALMATKEKLETDLGDKKDQIASGEYKLGFPNAPGYASFLTKYNNQYIGMINIGKGWIAGVPGLVNKGGVSSRWEVRQTPEMKSDGTFSLMNTANGKYYLGATYDNNFHGGIKVSTTATDISENSGTIWQPEDAGNGYIRIKNTKTNTYLCICGQCPGYFPTGLSISAHHRSPDQSSHILWKVENFAHPTQGESYETKAAALTTIEEQINKLKEDVAINPSGEILYFKDRRCGCFDGDPKWAGMPECFNTYCTSGRAYSTKEQDSRIPCKIGAICQNIIEASTGQGNIVLENVTIRNECNAAGVELPAPQDLTQVDITSPTIGIPNNPVPIEEEGAPSGQPSGQPQPQPQPKPNWGFFMALLGFFLFLAGAVSMVFSKGFLKTMGLIGVIFGLLLFFIGIGIYISGRREQSSTETFQDNVVLTEEISEIEAETGETVYRPVPVDDIFNQSSEEPMVYRIKIGSYFFGLCQNCTGKCQDLLCPKFEGYSREDAGFQIEVVDTLSNSVAIKNSSTGNYLSVCPSCLTSCEDAICVNSINSTPFNSQFTLIDNGDTTVSFLCANGRYLQLAPRTVHPGCFSNCSPGGILAAKALQIDNNCKFSIIE